MWPLSTHRYFSAFQIELLPGGVGRMACWVLDAEMCDHWSIFGGFVSFSWKAEPFTEHLPCAELRASAGLPPLPHQKCTEQLLGGRRPALSDGLAEEEHEPLSRRPEPGGRRARTPAALYGAGVHRVLGGLRAEPEAWGGPGVS